MGNSPVNQFPSFPYRVWTRAIPNPFRFQHFLRNWQTGKGAKSSNFLGSDSDSALCSVPRSHAITDLRKGWGSVTWGLTHPPQLDPNTPTTSPPTPPTPPHPSHPTHPTHRTPRLGPGAGRCPPPAAPPSRSSRPNTSPWRDGGRGGGGEGS